jgi:hypothetical protein
MPAARSGTRRAWSVAATAGGRREMRAARRRRSPDLHGVGRLQVASRLATPARRALAVRITWYVRYPQAIDTQVPQEQTIAVRWLLRVLRTIPLTPWWVHARRQRNRREMREHLRRYYAPGQ